MPERKGNSMADSITCRKCGTANPADSQYCDQCSAPLQGQPERVGTPQAARSPASRPTRISATPPASLAATPPAPAPASLATTPPAPPPATLIRPAGEELPSAAATLPLADPPGSPVRVAPAASTVTLPVRRSLPAALLIGGALVVALLGVALGAVLTGNGGGTPTPQSATPSAASSSGATMTLPGVSSAATPMPNGASTATGVLQPPIAPATLPPTTAALLPGGEGARLLAAGQYDAALAVFSTTLATAPNDPPALLGRGQALVGLRRYAEAVNTLTQALAVRGPEDGPALLARAQANAGQRSWALVLQDTDVLLKADGKDVPTLVLHAQAHAGIGDTAAATADYAAALAAHPQDARIYRARAAFYDDAHNKAATIADLKQVTALAPNDTDGWLALGRAYLSYDAAVATDPAPAQAAFEQALAINPRLAAAYYERAMLYHNFKNDPTQSLADINQAITFGPATADMYHLRADLEGDLENFSAQLSDLNAAVTVNPKEESPYWWREDYYYRHGGYDKAVADMSQAIALTADAAAYQQRSLLYLLQADYAHAGGDAQEAIRQLPDRSGGYYAQTLIAFSQGNYTAALDMVNKALDRAQSYEKANIQALRGRIYLRLKQFAPAKADLDAVIAAEKINVVGLLGQAELAQAQGQTDAAGTALDACVENNNGFGACFVLRAGREAGQGATDAARADLAEAHKRVLFPDEQRAAAALAAQLK